MGDPRRGLGTDRATVATWVKRLAARLDAGMLARGKFSRAENSLAYGRRVSDGRQKIHLDLLVRPAYARDAFHLSLRAAVHFPEMARIATAMLGTNAGGYGKGGIVHVAVLDMITPNPPMVLFRTAEDLSTLAADVERYLSYIVAYLDERDSIEKLTTAMWRSWSESMKPSLAFPEAAAVAGAWPVMIAAGQVAVGDRRAALKTLERCYPRGSAERAEYNQAFSWIGQAGISGRRD